MVKKKRKYPLVKKVKKQNYGKKAVGLAVTAVGLVGMSRALRHI